MLPTPKICIVFNSGAAGDFLALMLTNQFLKTNTIQLEPTGAILKPPGHEFKMAATEFYKTKFNQQCFDGIKNEPIVNTHYCYSELINIFPECKFYYINDRDHVNATVEVYIQKRFTNTTIKNYIQHKVTKPSTNKLNRLTDEQVLQIIKNDWNKNLDIWQKMALPEIKLPDMVKEDTCRQLLSDILQVEVNEEIFQLGFRTWEQGNQKLIKLILNE